MSVIDHFVVAGKDLSSLSRWFADLTGVEPTPGGSHKGVGSRNALVSLGERTYLELIAVDPDQPEPAQPRPFGIDELDDHAHPLVTYGVWPDDIDQAVADLEAKASISLGAVSDMARKTPDGTELAWRLTASPYTQGGGVFPFLIDWGTTPHPAASAAKGCTVESVTLHHPQPATVEAALDVLKLNIPTAERAQPGLSLRLATPNGVVELS